MQRRNFIKVMGGATVVAATTPLMSGCISSAYPSQALEAWNGPAQAETDPRRRALAYAITAPNPHNLQPWLVDLREENVISLYTDPERILPETDPFGRQILIGHGAFLELLSIALAELGFSAKVTLWPEGELPANLKEWRSQANANKPIARIVLKQGSDKDALFAQILKRHTPKTAYDITKPVPQEMLTKLQNTHSPGSKNQIQFGSTVEIKQVEALRDLCLSAAKVEVDTPHTMMESIRLLRVGPEEILKHRDGISINSLFVRALTALDLFDRSAAPKIGSTGHKNAMKRFEEHSKTAMGFVWLSSSNSRSDQINVGRAYVRLHLQATAQGLAMHPMSQALQEFAEMRPYFERTHQLLLGKAAPTQPQDETVQMFCRIGYSDAASATPRRALDQFVKRV